MSEKWAGELPTAAAAALPISRTQAHVRRPLGVLGGAEPGVHGARLLARATATCKAGGRGECELLGRVERHRHRTAAGEGGREVMEGACGG